MDEFRLNRLCRYSLIFLPLFALEGCRQRKTEQTGPPPVVSASLQQNNLKDLGGPVYQSQAESVIRWQRWSQETFDHAREAKRLLLVVIVMPQQPAFQTVLATIARDPAMLKSLNEDYVPVLVDGEAAREIGLLTPRLASEIDQPLELPMFLWMSHEANPVAWLPVSSRNPAGVSQTFNQSHEMVSRMWREDHNYVLENSRLDNEGRRLRFTNHLQNRTVSEDPASDSVQAMRQLTSLYDRFSRNIDEAGGLFPTGILDVLATGSTLQGVPENIRERSSETVSELLKDLMPSPMFDPLGGGVFSGRASQSWALPNFTRNCSDQARTAIALIRCHQLTGDPAILRRAQDLLAFAERRFRTDDGLFVFGDFGAGRQDLWLWTVEEVEKTLGEREAKEWIAATGMKNLGNLPSEVDPTRKWFRANSLALVKPLEETAKSLGVPPEEFTQRFEQSRQKLLTVRQERQKGRYIDSSPHVGANFRMVSAYAAAFCATGDEAYREKAVALLAKAKEKFYLDGRLTVYGNAEEPAALEARASHYALAILAAQDVADIQLDKKPSGWLDELIAGSATRFGGESYLKEVSDDAKVIDLPISDVEKTFDDTSGGLFAMARLREIAGGAQGQSALADLSGKLVTSAVQKPILHTDMILAELIRNHAKQVICGSDLSPELRKAVERLPLQVIPRRLAKDSDGIPAGSVRVVSPDGSVKLISEPSALRQELLSATKNP